MRIKPQHSVCTVETQVRADENVYFLRCSFVIAMKKIKMYLFFPFQAMSAQQTVAPYATSYEAGLRPAVNSVVFLRIFQSYV